MFSLSAWDVLKMGGKGMRSLVSLARRGAASEFAGLWIITVVKELTCGQDEHLAEPADGGPHGRMKISFAGSFITASSSLDTKPGGDRLEKPSFVYRGYVRDSQAVMAFQKAGPQRRIIGTTTLTLGPPGVIYGANCFWNHAGRESDFRFQRFNLTRPTT